MVRRRLASPSLAGVAGLLVTVTGLFAGLGRLDDNSFYTHLATGRLIVAHWHIPHHDPYTFTAYGHGWVVQSWLAELAFGLGDKAAGAGGVLVIVAAASAVLAALVWMLTRPATTLVPRLVVAAAVVGVGFDFWLERPLLFGLVALALALLGAEGRLDPRWLVPTFWVWVNVHGSFPLGLVALGALALGRRLDGEAPDVELRALKWAGAGTLLGAVSPLGPRLLVFPLELLSRQHILSNVIEWQAPRFQSISERVFLLEAVVALLVLVRRPSWRAALPLAVFVAAALLGARNIVVASIVLVPGTSRGLAGLGTVTGEERRSILRIAAAAVVAVSLLAAIARIGETYPPAGYPVRAVEYLERHGLTKAGTHVVAEDFIGNFLEARLGARRIVFIDDRYDMLPTSVVEDYFVILRGQPGWDRVLERYEPAAILWQRRLPLAQLLQASGDWRIVFRDKDWLIAVPR